MTKCALGDTSEYKDPADKAKKMKGGSDPTNAYFWGKEQQNLPREVTSYFFESGILGWKDADNFFNKICNIFRVHRAGENFHQFLLNFDPLFCV